MDIRYSNIKRPSDDLPDGYSIFECQTSMDNIERPSDDLRDGVRYSNIKCPSDNLPDGYSMALLTS